MADGKDDIQLDRRNFFRLGAHKAAKAAVGVAEARILQKAKRYIRPPFAIDEIDFLINCTRCDDCIAACPHETIFPLSAKMGIEVAGTPALDLTNGACHLCQDWPCVTACEPEVLKLPEQESLENDDVVETITNPPLPRLAQAYIDPEICLPFKGPECGVCGSYCPVPEAISWKMSKPHINPKLCTGCALCRQNCITEPKAVTIKHSQNSD